MLTGYALGDCKALMFTQISPRAADLRETLCSLNFASRVQGVKNGPARKHTNHTEFYKYKQMVDTHVIYVSFKQ
ncbi:Kinesin-like protein KIN-14S [Euphorbia peplus]|nr:Kinesin-like protein KIN-14S [Euphorbia peplus]